MKKSKVSRFSPGQELYLKADTCGLLKGITLFSVTGQKLRDHRIKVRDRTGRTYCIYSKYLATTPAYYKRYITFVVINHACGLPVGSVVFAEPGFIIRNQRIRVKDCEGNYRNILLDYLERV